MNATSFAYLYFLSLSRWDNEYLCYLILYAVLKTYFTELTVHFKLSLIKCYYIYLPSALFSCMPAIQLALLSFWLRCVQQFLSKPYLKEKVTLAENENYDPYSQLKIFFPFKIFSKN